MNLRLRLLALYPEQMNIYADRGNLLFLRRRCEWRGIGFELVRAGIGERFDPETADLIYIGGGQDRDQLLVAEDMRKTKREAIARAVEAETVLLAVCGGYQLLGHSYQLADRTVAGLGIADLETVRSNDARLIGNVAIELPASDRPADGARVLAGFENHGGRTRLGADAEPLGRVLRGHGNNGSDGFEGVRLKNLFGTYLHGPLLPKNAWFADYLIGLSLARQNGGKPLRPTPLDDRIEAAAHACARAAAGLDR